MTRKEDQAGVVTEIFFNSCFIILFSVCQVLISVGFNQTETKCFVQALVLAGAPGPCWLKL